MEFNYKSESFDTIWIALEVKRFINRNKNNNLDYMNI